MDEMTILIMYLLVSLGLGEAVLFHNRKNNTIVKKHEYFIIVVFWPMVFLFGIISNLLKRKKP